MKKKAEIRAYRKEDMNGLLEAANKVFGDVLTPDYWRWKYHDNPVSGYEISALAESEGEIVAFIGAHLRRFDVQGQPMIGTREDDLFVAEEWRKSRLYLQVFKKRLELQKARGIEFSFGCANPIISKVALKLFNIRRVTSITRVVLPVGLSPYLARFLPSPVARMLAWPMDRFLVWRATKGSRLPSGMKLEKLDRFDERFDRLWERLRGDYPIIGVRDADYLNWRFVANPAIRYERLAVVDDKGEIRGYLVAGFRREKIGMGQIADLVVPRNEDPRVARSLIAESVRLFSRCGMRGIACWMLPHTHLFQILSAMGFTPRGEGRIDLAFRNTDLENEAIPLDFALDSENWFFTFCDSDTA